MGIIRTAVLSGLGAIALAFNIYAGDLSFRAQSVLASLRFLDEQAHSNKYPPDQIRSIEIHIRQVIKNIKGDEFSPIYHKKMEDGSCGDWHKIPWLDNSCWAKEIICTLNCDFESNYDYGCGPHGEGRWCCAGIVTCCAWPTTSLVLVGLGGIAQVLLYGGSIPCRFCEGTKEGPQVNTYLIQSFIQQKAIELNEKVKENNIQLTPHEKTELERLISLK